jgi:flavin reductase (DIM6/NTAB) family NADH-FMN oxidoreductase RutF
MRAPSGLRLAPGRLDQAAQARLLSDVLAVIEAAPLYTPRMPRTGAPMSVRMTNCGALGWLTDQAHGYRYTPSHPETGRSWPPIPQVLLDLWEEFAVYRAPPEACLVNVYREGARMGLTLTSATSLSTEPPMLIACINRSASARALLTLGTPLGWQVLGANQQDVADRFSGRGGVQGEARFDGAEWHSEQGAYLLDGAALACAGVVDDLIERATHTILIARITSLHARADVGALTYHNGAYLPLR